MNDNEMITWSNHLLTAAAIKVHTSDKWRWTFNSTFWMRRHAAALPKLVTGICTRFSKEEIEALKEQAENPAFIELLTTILENHHG